MSESNFQLDSLQILWTQTSHKGYRVGCSEAELCLIHTAVGGEWSPPPADVVDLDTVAEVRVHSGDVQGEGRGPGEEDGWPLEVYCKVLHCS